MTNNKKFPHRKIMQSLYAWLSLALMLQIIIAFAPKNSAYGQPENIALGKKVTANKPVNYASTIDKDLAQITDGKYAGEEFKDEHKSSSLWLQKGAVTWRPGESSIIITIDLEKSMPVSGISYSTAAGKSGVQWPSYIGIFLSDDSKTWSYAGDLLNSSFRNGAPNPKGYSRFKYITHDLKTKGRYVALVIKQSPYTVVDEVEVYAGENTASDTAAKGQQFESLEKVPIDAFLETGLAHRRVIADIEEIKRIVKDSAKITAAQKSTFLTRLEQVYEKNEARQEPMKNIRTILPLNDVHVEALSIYGEFLAAAGKDELIVWKQHRYAWLQFIAEPVEKTSSAVNINLLKNQSRADAFLLTNASGKEKTVTLEVESTFKKEETNWLDIQSVVWTDTRQGVPVADALMPVKRENGKYHFTIPAGFTQKVWVTVNSATLPAGTHKSTFHIGDKKIPFTVTVYPLEMQRPRLSLAMFDYTDNVSIQTKQSRGITSSNKATSQALMKSHYVDSPWAHRSILPWPGADDFNVQNQLVKKLDFSNLAEWIREWPEARYYYVFINATQKTTFAGAKRGTPAFSARLNAYCQVLADELKKLGLKPSQLCLLINDEPGLYGEWQNDVIADWARVIKGGNSGLGLMSDTLWKRPDLQKNQDFLNLMDILMPNFQGVYEYAPPAVQKYFQQHRQAGKKMWFYACTGPVRLFDPQNYYRNLAWHVFSVGGEGMTFWSFGDTSGMPTAWQDYRIKESFAPAFIDKNTVYSSVHWEAVREGVEDFEELSMLRDAQNSTNNATLKEQAHQLLSGVTQVATSTKSTDAWNKEIAPEYVDRHLNDVRNLLVKMNAHNMIR